MLNSLLSDTVCILWVCVYFFVYIFIWYILYNVCNSYVYTGVVNDSQFILQIKYAHSPIHCQHIICNVFTNISCMPCSHTINPNNETCLVTCAVSLACATWLICMHRFLFDPPLIQDI